MTNQEEPKELKVLFILGSDLCLPDDIEALFKGKDNWLIVGDGVSSATVKDIKSKIAELNATITPNTYTCIYAHGNRTQDKKIAILAFTSFIIPIKIVKEVYYNMGV